MCPHTPYSPSISNFIAFLFLGTHFIFFSTFSLSIPLHAFFLGLTSERRKSMKKRKKNSQSQSPILRMRGRKRPVGRSKTGTGIQHRLSTFSSGSGMDSPAQRAAASVFSLKFVDHLLKPTLRGKLSAFTSFVGVCVCVNGNMFNYIGSTH